MNGWLHNLIDAAQRTDLSSPGELNTLLVQWGAVLGASLAAAVWDLRCRRIPNALTLPLFVAGIAFNTWAQGFSGAALSLGGAAIATLPFVLLYLYAGGGAGDAKLMAAVGAWLCLAQSVVVLLAVVAMGAVLGLAQAAWQRQFAAVTARVGNLVRSAFGMWSVGQRPMWSPVGDTQGLQMPYGVSIFTGVALAAIGSLLWNV
jgi:Flp pilus assembly protein protease CpaA